MPMQLTFRFFLVGLLTFGALGLEIRRSEAQAAPQPNILVVMTDDQDSGSVSVMPQLQTLWVAQGVTFSNAFNDNPLCCPGRATILTGQTAHSHGVWDNMAPGGYGGLQYGTTLPVWLQAAGYYTAWMGKFLNGYGITNTPGDDTPACREIPAGWSEWYGIISPPDYNNFSVNERGVVTRYGNAVLPRGCTADASLPNIYQTDLLAQKGEAFILSRAGTGQPWLLVVGIHAPHRVMGGNTAPPPASRHLGAFSSAPFPTSVAFNEADVSDKPAFIRALPLLTATQTQQYATVYRRQLETLLAVDEAIARFEAALVSSGQAGNTVRVYTSDNGSLPLGDHRWVGDKFVVYEGSQRVPLIVRGPGYQAGVTLQELVGNVDFAATIAALANATPTRTQDGADLGPLLSGAPVSWRTALLFEAKHARSTYFAIRTAGHVYVEHQTGEQELYDLGLDPWQLTSEHANPAYASLKAALASQLATLTTCVGAGCWQ